MTDMYSSPTERAKDEYWLNQDRIEMTLSERIERHKCDCIMVLREEISSLKEVLEDLDGWSNLDLIEKLYKIDKEIQ